MAICLKCEKEFIPTRNTKGMYCSYACSNGAKAVRYDIICKSCGKSFWIKNIAEIKRGHYKYCSNECRKRKFKIEESFFNKINNETSYWMGFVWATLYSMSYNTIQLKSKKELLERFNVALNSDYPIRKLGNKFTIKITSIHMLNDLSNLGLQPLLIFPEIPREYYKDFIRGYFDSDSGFFYKMVQRRLLLYMGTQLS